MKLPYFLIAFFEYSPPALSIPLAVNLEDEAEAGGVWCSKTD